MENRQTNANSKITFKNILGANMQKMEEKIAKKANYRQSLNRHRICFQN